MLQNTVTMCILVSVCTSSGVVASVMDTSRAMIMHNVK